MANQKFKIATDGYLFKIYCSRKWTIAGILGKLIKILSKSNRHNMNIPGLTCSVPRTCDIAPKILGRWGFIWNKPNIRNITEVKRDCWIVLSVKKKKLNKLKVTIVDCWPAFSPQQNWAFLTNSLRSQESKMNIHIS